ncbi:hypothetical protein E2C01_038539 [Portunus trituberculatus]|uniref:Uncharacterized protein n=1 Tax=Portunus trituberculatus TaxID=210409 RepID=A0A5B7FIT5_PORTR|nr:hypothetical protein [Portunus trituberculatus]
MKKKITLTSERFSGDLRNNSSSAPTPTKRHSLHDTQTLENAKDTNRTTLLHTSFTLPNSYFL